VSSFELAVPAAQAIELFTPEGERLWAGDAWDPRYPVALADGATGAERGTVFVTRHGHAETVWVATANDGGSVTYARATPGATAGLVGVRCASADPETTTVEVTYELSSLTDAADVELDDFARGYEQFIASWKDELEALGRGSRRGGAG
jgi:hypothetical protein